MRTYDLAAPVDMSKGFSDFFGSIGMTGEGLVFKATAAVIAVVAVRMLLQSSGDPQSALRKGGMAIAVLFVAVALAKYGDDLFSTITEAKG
jgi:hypothetical protein